MSFKLLYDVSVSAQVTDPEEVSFNDFVESLPSPLAINIEFNSPTRIRYKSEFTLESFSRAHLPNYGDILGMEFKKGLGITIRKPYCKVVSIDETEVSEPEEQYSTVEQEFEDEAFPDLVDVTVSIYHCARALALERATFEIEHIRDHYTSDEVRMERLMEKYTYYFADLLSLEECRLEQLHEEEERIAEMMYDEEYEDAPKD